jgi:hypothetical protein
MLCVGTLQERSAFVSVGLPNWFIKAYNILFMHPLLDLGINDPGAETRRLPDLF